MAPQARWVLLFKTSQHATKFPQAKTTMFNRAYGGQFDVTLVASNERQSRKTRCCKPLRSDASD